MSSEPTTAERLSRLHRQFERGEPSAWLTAYDFPQGRLLDQAGADVLLCGDSLGMVVLGMKDTIDVTIADMIRHTAAVARGRSQALLIADLPHGADASADLALENAQSLIEAGADAVKLEGASEKRTQIQALTAAGIPLCAHLGMLPQSVRKEGGYHKKGRQAAEAEWLIGEAKLAESLGAFAIVLESVASPTAEQMAAAVSIPCIGIGTGPARLAGQVRVIHDVTGAYPWFVPPFANPHADVAGSVAHAATLYVEHVRKGETNP